MYQRQTIYQHTLKCPYLQSFGEEVALLDIVLRWINHVNIVESSEAPRNTAVFLQRLDRLPPPFAVFRVLCQPPHHKIRLEGLKEKHFTWKFGEQPCNVHWSGTKESGLYISAFITDGENRKVITLKRFFLTRLSVCLFFPFHPLFLRFVVKLCLDSRHESDALLSF